MKIKIIILKKKMRKKMKKKSKNKFILRKGEKKWKI